MENLLPCAIISYCSFIRYSRVYLYCIVASQRFASQSAVSAQINDSKRLLLAGASISKKVAFMIGHFMVKSESLKIPTFYRWPFFFFEGQHFWEEKWLKIDVLFLLLKKGRKIQINYFFRHEIIPFKSYKYWTNFQ